MQTGYESQRNNTMSFTLCKRLVVRAHARTPMNRIYVMANFIYININKEEAEGKNAVITT